MVSNNGIDELNDEMIDDDLQMELTDEAYEELAASEGAAVVGLAFWSASLADALENEEPAPEERRVIDVDLYLDDNTQLELFGVSLFRVENSEPITGLAALEAELVNLADNEGVLDEVAQTDEGDLALVFAVGDEPLLIMVVGAWAVSEYDELPEE